jgi:hypothetical protein
VCNGVNTVIDTHSPMHCTALHCTALHCTVLHCTALYCTALQVTWTPWSMSSLVGRLASPSCTLLPREATTCRAGEGMVG